MSELDQLYEKELNGLSRQSLQKVFPLLNTLLSNPGLTSANVQQQHEWKSATTYQLLEALAHRGILRREKRVKKVTYSLTDLGTVLFYKIKNVL